MPDINLRECRKQIDRTYIGFDINGPKVKPVHIINGVLRTICGKVYDTKAIKELSYVESKKGVPGYTTGEVLSKLKENEKVDEAVTYQLFEALRKTMQDLLDADDAVYSGKDDHMISYSLSSQPFITNAAMYEDAGEFIGGIIKQYCPELAHYIRMVTDKKQDAISILFLPVLSSEYREIDSTSRHESMPWYRNEYPAFSGYIDGLKTSASCLLKNLQTQTNCFSQLRTFNFFCMYQLFRYLGYLETVYCGGIVKPIVLDFTTNPRGSIAAASAMSYAFVHKSLARFYAWGYSQILREHDYSSHDLMSMVPPIKQSGKVSDADKNEIESLWNMAKSEAASCASEDEAILCFGMAIYNMLAREANFHPANYLRALGILSGFLYPPNSQHNRFCVSQDFLEMILMCSVEPTETITGQELRTRLNARLGIIIGRNSVDNDYWNENGAILQVDEDVLDFNFQCFTNSLESLGFAEILADGILQIQVGGLKND